jgi:hypothetical protein
LRLAPQAKDRKGKDLYTRRENNPPQRDGLVDWEKLMGTITANRTILATRAVSLADTQLPEAVDAAEGKGSSPTAPPGDADARPPKDEGSPP